MALCDGDRPGGGNRGPGRLLERRLDAEPGRFHQPPDRICAGANTAIGRAATPPATATAEQVTTYTEMLLGIVAPALSRLAALKAAPDTTTALDQDLLAPQRALGCGRQMLIDNVQEANGDAATEDAALAYFVGSSTDPEQPAHDQALATLGFRACDHLGEPSPAGTAPGTTPGHRDHGAGRRPPTTAPATPGNTAPDRGTARRRSWRPTPVSAPPFPAPAGAPHEPRSGDVISSRTSSPLPPPPPKTSRSPPGTRAQHFEHDGVGPERQQLGGGGRLSRS